MRTLKLARGLTAKALSLPVAILMLTAQTPSPSLSDTTNWLGAALPSKTYIAGFEYGESVDYQADHKFSNCIWTIKRGRWTALINRDPTFAGKQTIWLRFAPRAGLSFETRSMTASEAQDFARSHTHKSGQFLGYVDTIDLSKVRPGSFSIDPPTTETPADIWVGAASEKYAFVTVDSLDADMLARYAAALRHAAELCGAKDDPF